MKKKGAEYVWFDGKFVKWNEAQIPITTHALHYGTSVFEGIRAYYDDNLYVFRLEEHIERLYRSASIYSMNIKHSKKTLVDATLELIRKSKIKESCYIRPLGFVGTHGIDLNVNSKSPVQVIIIVFPFARYFDVKGINVGISSWRRINDMSTPPIAKAGGNYLNSILATQECKRNGYDEAIMLDWLGNVSEAPGENIFVIKNGEIYTPDLASSILEGITRNSVINIARDLGYKITERPVSRSELYVADEIFLTGTAAEIIGVLSVDKKIVGNGKEGKITKKIREEYSQIVVNKVDKYKNWLTAVW